MNNHTQKSHRWRQNTLPRFLISLIVITSGIVSLALNGTHPQAQIVNNSATGESSEDSITVAAMALDSLGNPSSADSFYVVIFGGGNSNAAVFTDSGTSAMTGLDSVVVGGLADRKSVV